MKVISQLLIFLIAAFHVWILVLEMFLWQTSFGFNAFGTTPETAKLTAPMAANQGLYNGFLAAGLFFALIANNINVKKAFSYFFLGCVLVAGIYGGVTVKISILYMQALPALVALVVYWLSSRSEG